MDLVEISKRYSESSRGSDSEEKQRRNAALTAAAILGGAVAGGAAGKGAGWVAIGRKGRQRVTSSVREYAEALDDPNADPDKILAATKKVRRGSMVPLWSGRAGVAGGAYGGYRLTDPNRKRSE